MQLLPYLVVIPLAAAFMIPIGGRRMKWLGGVLSLLASFITCSAAFSIAHLVSRHKVLVYKVGAWLPPAGIPMVVDGLSAFLLVTVNLVAFLTALYSIDYIKKYTDTWKFYTLFMIMLSGMNGVLLAGDIFNLYVFLEIAAITGYFLVAFGTEPEELEAAFKYAVMGTVASIFILLGIALLYSRTSTLNMADMAGILAVGGKRSVIQFVTVLFMMGFGLKASLVPFHSWLPYAHSSAPAPISAMLSGVSIKVLGIYALTRIFFNVFGAGSELLSILIVLGVLSMITGAILAFGQSDIKRLFAYSSISQIGYIALAFGIATPLSILGGLFHLFNHSVFKSLLFLNSGSIEHVAGTRELNKINGVASTSPVTGYTNLIASLSICGIPPLGGFWSKLVIILACIQAGRSFVAFIAVLVSMMTLAYYFRALSPALFGAKDREDNGMIDRRISWSMSLAMIVLAAISMASGYMLVPSSGNGFNVLLRSAQAAVTNSTSYAAMVMGAIR